jgi:uncharacterized protein YbbC (DUF1343 family)
LARRQVVAGIGAGLANSVGSVMTATAQRPVTTTGAMALAARRFADLAGLRIGVLTNQTGRVGAAHLVDLMAASPGVRPAAIFAPEHGFRGSVEAGAKVADGRDAATGIPIVSLYGANRAPTPAQLAALDLLVFDIQDIGARFYTYISTMGLAMQAAARRGIPFLVLDRPNPLGGTYCAGFVLEPQLRSFVGQYPIPIVHGMTVGELALMIRGERWLPDLDALDLRIEPVTGWRRALRFPSTRLPWLATSPNIPTFTSALVYSGIGIVGETLVNEGRGTPVPFEQFGAPWLDAPAIANRLGAAGLPGVAFAPTRYVPRAIANVAARPRFKDEAVNGVRLQVTDADAYRPLEVGMHALAELVREARRRNIPVLPRTAMFSAIAGTRRLEAMLDRGAGGGDLIAAWQREVTAFDLRRRPYLRYT